VANLKALDSLLSLAGKRQGSRQVAASGLEALQELFSTCLLPDRKLRVFEAQPLQVSVLVVCWHPQRSRQGGCWAHLLQMCPVLGTCLLTAAGACRAHVLSCRRPSPRPLACRGA
jgi:hypothetical protein